MSTLWLWPDRTSAWLQQHDMWHARTGQGLCTSNMYIPLMRLFATLHAYLGSRHPYYTLHQKRRHFKPQRCVFFPTVNTETESLGRGKQCGYYRARRVREEFQLGPSTQVCSHAFAH